MKTNEDDRQKKKYAFLFVHGLGQGSWCWRHVRMLLEQRYHKVITPDLPSKSLITSNLARVGFSDDVNCVINEANAVKLPVVLIGHLTGSLAISQAAEQLGAQKIHRIIYIDQYQPDTTNCKTFSGIDTLRHTLRHWEKELQSDNYIQSGDKLSVRLDNDYVKKIYQGCSGTEVRFALKQQLWQSTASLLTPLKLSRAGYGSINKKWINCIGQAGSKPNANNTNDDTAEMYTLPSGPAPFFEMPAKLVDLILTLV